MDNLAAELAAIRQTLHEAAATLAAKGEPDAGAMCDRAALRCDALTKRVASDDAIDRDLIARLVDWAKADDCPDANLVNQAATRLARRVSI